MLNKAFILPQFGPPHAWTAQYLDHVRTLAPYGWHWKILTPHAYPSGGNVEIVPMTLADFNARVLETTGVITDNVLDAAGLPAKLLSDYYPAFGDLFPDLLAGFDYWSATNWDIVYGRLDHFLSDEELSRFDLWSDDCGHINSIFCFYKNIARVNRLYRQVPHWQAMFRHHGYPLFGFDEIHFNKVIREMAARGQVTFGHPPYFAYHSYDRLVQHQPAPNLTMAPDGALLECFEDDFAPLATYPQWRGYFGREVMYFHFIRSKSWPILRPYPKASADTAKQAEGGGMIVQHPHLLGRVHPCCRCAKAMTVVEVQASERPPIGTDDRSGSMLCDSCWRASVVHLCGHEGPLGPVGDNLKVIA